MILAAYKALLVLYKVLNIVGRVSLDQGDLTMSDEKVSRRNYVKYAGAAVVVVAGAAAGAYYATRPKEQEVLKIAYDFAPCEAPFFVAITNKLFEAEGLTQKFEIFPCGSAAELREAIHTGNAILGYCAYEFIPAVDEGADYKYVEGMHTGCHEIFVSDRLVAQGITDEKSLANYLIEGRDAGQKRDVCISTVGNSPYFFFGMFLEQNGLSFDDVNVTVYEMPSVITGMQEGKFDIACEWDPIPWMAERDIGAKIILDPAVHAPYNRMYCCYVGMNNTFMKTYPDTALKVLKALHKANIWVGEHEQEAAEIMRSYGEQLVPFTVDELVTDLTRYDFANPGDVAREQETLKTYANIIYKAGMIKHDGDWIVANGYEHLYP